MPAKKKATPKAPEPTTAPTDSTIDIPVHIDWRDPNFKPAADDEGLEARMWRIAQRQQGK